MAEFTEFENENRLRAYPFAESSSFIASLASSIKLSRFSLNNCFILSRFISTLKPFILPPKTGFIIPYFY